MSTNNTIASLHPDVRDSLKDEDWTDVEIKDWLTGHNASIRRAVLKEEPSDAECIAILNAVTVPLGDPPAEGDWAPGAIRRCREALIVARNTEGDQA